MSGSTLLILEESTLKYIAPSFQPHHHISIKTF